MQGEHKSLHEMIYEFFQYYPDYAFCRTLASNVKNSVTTYEDAIEILSKKLRAARENREEIEEKLNRRSVSIDGDRVLIKDLSLRQIMDQQDDVLKEILDFYFKHPYAHGRTKKTQWLPRRIRTLFLSVLVGHAKRRRLNLDYDEYFHMLELL